MLVIDYINQHEIEFILCELSGSLCTLCPKRLATKNTKDTQSAQRSMIIKLKGFKFFYFSNQFPLIVQGIILVP